jgi:hypothetical protein
LCVEKFLEGAFSDRLKGASIDDLEEKGKDAWFQARKEGLKESDVIEGIIKRSQGYGGQETLF